MIAVASARRPYHFGGCFVVPARFADAPAATPGCCELPRLRQHHRKKLPVNVNDGFFQQRPDIKPIIYAYELVGVASHKGYIKVGETTRTAAERIKFATRIPVFMYLTDYREMSLVDVITDLEPELFKRVTGLNVKDFELLVPLNVFNEGLMNDVVYKFKRYEDASLTYTGIDKNTGENVGLYNMRHPTLRPSVRVQH